jgi:hypothetical protein
MKAQTEPAINGTSDGFMDGIWSAHLSGSNGFTWNVGRKIGLLTGGGFATPLGQLR